MILEFAIERRKRNREREKKRMGGGENNQLNWNDMSNK